jgi:hypothetical protein
MYSSNIPQPGQINYDKQQALLEGMPNNTSSLQEIQKLLSNPTSPFAQFLLLGKQEQINKALAADARQKALQGDQGGPPPTIAQKTQQMSGILALQNAQRNAMGAPVPGAVVPSGGIPHPVPQPSATPNMGAQEEQAEPEQAPAEQAAAGGGIMHAPVDPRMFNFADGGIVAFASKGKVEDKLVIPQLSNDNQTLPSDDGDQPALGSIAQLSNDGQTLPLGKDRLLVTPEEGAAANTARRDIDPAILAALLNSQDYAAPPGEASGAIQRTNLLPRGQGSALNQLNSILDYFGNTNTGSQRNIAAQGPANLTPPAAAAPAANPTAAAPTIQPGASDTNLAMLSDPRVQDAIVNAGKQGINLNKTGQMVAPVAAPGASAAPAAGAPGISGLPKLQSGNVDATPAGILKLTNALKMANPFEAKAEAAYSSATPEAYDQAKEIKRIQDENKAFEVGKFSENRRAQLDNLEKMFQANRPSTLEQLLELGHTYSSRGARFGDVGATGAKQMREEREAQMQFAQAKDKALEAIEKEDQAIRIGNVSDLRAARKDKDKAIQEWKNQGATLYESLNKTRGSSDAAAQQTAGHIIGQQISADAQLRAAQLHLLAAQTTANKPSEAERFEKQMNETYAAAEKAKPGSGTAAVEALVKTRATAESAVQGKKYDQPDKTSEHSAKVYDILNRDPVYNSAKNVQFRLGSKTNLNDKDKAKLDAANTYTKNEFDRVSKTVAGGVLPETNTPAPGNKPDLDTFLNAARTLNPGVSDAALTTYYNSKYK